MPDHYDTCTQVIISHGDKAIDSNFLALNIYSTAVRKKFIEIREDENV